MAELLASVRGPGDTDSVADLYLSARELAARIPFSVSSIRNMAQSGVFREGLHFFRKNGRMVFSWSAVRAWIEAGDEVAAEVLEPAHRDTTPEAEPFDQNPKRKRAC